MLQGYECVLTPDYSLYTDMLQPVKIWNTYRSRAIGQYFQECGIKVIPTVSWADKDSYDYCFRGIEEGGIIAVSTIGVKKNKNALKLWKEGMAKAIECLEPETILVYGGKIDFDFGNIQIVNYDNLIERRFDKL